MTLVPRMRDECVKSRVVTGFAVHACSIGVGCGSAMFHGHVGTSTFSEDRVIQYGEAAVVWRWVTVWRAAGDECADWGFVCVGVGMILGGGGFRRSGDL